jgi:hypothetical protein
MENNKMFETTNQLRCHIINGILLWHMALGSPIFWRSKVFSAPLVAFEKGKDQDPKMVPVTASSPSYRHHFNPGLSMKTSDSSKTDCFHGNVLKMVSYDHDCDLAWKFRG